MKTSGTGHYIVDKTLEKAGASRRVVLQLPSFLEMGRIVAETDLIATVPEKYATAISTGAALQLLPCPFAMPNFPVKQHWHERYHADSATAGYARLFQLCSLSEVLGRHRPVRGTDGVVRRAGI